MSAPAWLVGAALLCSACGTFRYYEAPLLASSPKKGPALLVLAGQEASFKEPYEEVALLQTDGTGTSSVTQKVYAALQARAGEYGCDAVLRARITSTSVGLTTATGVCVRVLR